MTPQGWALGMLDEVPSVVRANALLSHTVPEWGLKTLLDQAMEMERKEFLSHRYCQVTKHSSARDESNRPAVMNE